MYNLCGGLNSFIKLKKMRNFKTYNSKPSYVINNNVLNISEFSFAVKPHYILNSFKDSFFYLLKLLAKFRS